MCNRAAGAATQTVALAEVVTVRKWVLRTMPASRIYHHRVCMAVNYSVVNFLFCEIFTSVVRGHSNTPWGDTSYRIHIDTSFLWLRRKDLLRYYRFTVKNLTKI
jgi:hypothetical protein